VGVKLVLKLFVPFIFNESEYNRLGINIRSFKIRKI